MIKVVMIMTLTNRLNDLMLEKGISRMELAKESGVPYTTIVNFYEKGTDNVKLSTLKKLAEYFGHGIDYLVDGKQNKEIPYPNSIVNLPVIGRVSHENGILALQKVEGHEPTPQEWLEEGEYFYLRAKGDNMIGARIYDGDLLLIQKQEEVENGEIAVVLVGDEAVLKRVYKNGNQLLLQSENTMHQPLFVPSAKVRIVGKLRRNVIVY